VCLYHKVILGALYFCTGIDHPGPSDLSTTKMVDPDLVVSRGHIAADKESGILLWIDNLLRKPKIKSVTSDRKFVRKM
jgi:hypothetical protein